jgi:hypothetical protein
MVRNNGKEWAHTERISWNIFGSISDEVVTSKENDFKEAISSGGSQKLEYLGKATLEPEKEYRIKASFELEKADNWSYEGIFKTPKFIPKS